MATQAAVEPQQKFSLGALAFMAFMGLGLVFASGHVQSQVLHDAAHDMRHGLGFPCH